VSGIDRAAMRGAFRCRRFSIGAFSRALRTGASREEIEESVAMYVVARIRKPFGPWRHQ
jgi:hypothetical protein